MSNSANKWMSLYHHQALLEHPLLSPSWVSDPADSAPPYIAEAIRDPIPNPRPPWVARPLYEEMTSNPTAVVVVTGIGYGDEIEIGSVLRIESRIADTGHPVPGTIAELMESDRVLARAPLRKMAALRSCMGCEQDSGSFTGVLQAVLPDVAPGTMLRIVRNGEPIWSRQAPSEFPVVSQASAELENGILRVCWRTSAPKDNLLERLVRWSADEGHTWQALAVNLRENEAVESAAMLTTGRALVQVLVSDGFYTVAADPVPVDVPPRSPTVAILWPQAGATVRTDMAMRLWGLATSGDVSDRESVRYRT